MLIILFTCLIISPVTNSEKVYVQTIWALLTIAMAILLVLSMKRIDSYRKKLFEDTILLKSEWLRQLHLILFCSTAFILGVCVGFEILEKNLKNKYCEMGL